MWLDCWASAFLSSGFVRFLIQWAPIWIIHFARFFRSRQRWKQCWHVNGIAQNGYRFSLASVAGMPTSQRWLNPGIRLASVVNSPWEICEMLQITKEPSGFIFTSLTWPGLAPESPFPGRKLNLFFFFTLTRAGWAEPASQRGQLQAGDCSRKHFVFLSQTSSWCRYLGNKQPFCRPNISGLSLSWEQTVCFYSCKHTEDSYLVLPLQLIVI